MKKTVFVAAVLAFAGASLPTLAAGPQLFTTLPRTGAERTFAGAPPATPVQLNAAGMRTLSYRGEFEISLPTGLPQGYVIDLVQDHANGNTSYVAQHKQLGRTYRAIITVGTGGSFASISSPDGDYRIVPGGAGQDLLVLEPDFVHTGPAQSDVRTPPVSTKSAPASTNPADTMFAIPGLNTVPMPKVTPVPQAIVDILFVYTPQWVSAIGGAGNIQTRLDFLVTRANTAYADSEVAITMRKVGSMQVTYAGTNSGVALNEVTPTCTVAQCGNAFNASAFGGVEAMRTSKGADVVAFFMDQAGGGGFSGNGIAWLGSATPNPNLMYSVTQGCELGCESVFIHEVGHNMGNNHDIDTVRQQSGGVVTPNPAPSTTFSYGYAFCKSGALSCNPQIPNASPGACASTPNCLTNDGSNFKDLMAYFFAMNGSRLLYRFSNPLQADCFAPVAGNPGSPAPDLVPRPCGIAGQANTALVMNTNRLAISAIKASTVGSTLQFSTTGISANEGTDAVLTVTRTGGSTGAVSVNWATANGSATAPMDFTAASGTLNWADGDTVSKTITIPIINDGMTEGPEAFTVTLSGAAPAGTNGAQLGANAMAAVLIPGAYPAGGILPPEFVTPAGSAGAWSVVTDQAFEGANSLGSAQVLSANFGSFANSDMTFTGNFTSGMIFFAYRISSYQDGYSEFTFAIDNVSVLTEPGGESGWKIAAIPVAAGMHTLRWRFTNGLPFECDNVDPPATGGAACAGRAWIDTVSLPLSAGLSMATAAQSVPESAGNAMLMVNRSGDPTLAASVNYATVNGTAMAGTHYTATSGTLNWAPSDAAPKLISVPIVDDFVVNTSRTFTVNLSGATGGTLSTPVSTVVAIADDDNTLQFASATATVTEGPAPLTINVTRLGGTGGAASVNWSTVNGTAVSGTDFGAAGVPAAVSGTLTWAAGDAAAKTITVPLINDLLVQAPRTFTIVLSTPGGTGASLGAVTTATITMLDDEASINFGAATATVNEGSGAIVNIPVMRSGSSTNAVSVTWTTANGTAIAGSDFGTAGNPAQKTGVVTWGAGDSTTKNIQVGSQFSNIPILSDAVLEAPETFTITLSSPTNGAVLGPQPTVTVTILDDDSTIEFGTTTTTVSEAGPNTTLTLNRTGSSVAAASVTFTTANGTALSGSDYTMTTGTVSWPAGDGSPKTITIGPAAAAAPYIAVMNDAVIEGPETFTVTLSAPVGAALGANTVATVTIDSDDRGVAMATSTLAVGESAGTAQVMVMRTGPSTGAMSVNYTTTNGTATAPANYTTSTGTLNWADGDGAAKMISVPIIDNTTINTARTFMVTLSGAVGATIGAPVTTTVTINDDDNLVQFSAATVTITEGPTPLTLTITRTGITTGPATVHWSTLDGTATAGSDFGANGVATPVSGTVTWTAGDAASKTITIPIINDAVVEATKTFLVLLDLPTGTGTALGANAVATITLMDDESSINFASPTATVVEGGAAVNVAVNRSGAATGAVSVTWTTSNGTAIAGSDFGTAGNAAQKTGTLTWGAGDSAPKMITMGSTFSALPIINDTVVEPSKTFTITLSAPTGGAVLGPTSSATVTINDDDSTLEFFLPTATVSEAGPNTTLVVQRSGSTAAAASVTFTTANGTAMAGSDFMQTTGTVSWAAGDGAAKSITIGPTAAAAPYIPVINDTAIEGDETFTVTLSAPVGATLGNTKVATVTITSDDVGIAMGAATLSVAESVGSAQVVVNRVGPANGAISVNYATANGTAMAPANYTATTGTLNWADGDNAPKTINVPVIDNAAINTARTFMVNLSGAVGATIGTPASTTVTINDDDNTLQFSAATATITEGPTPLTLTVTRLGGTGGPATVNWSTVNGTALAGTDFGAAGNVTPVTGTVSWAAGDAASKTITIPIINDAIVESTKAFSVVLSAPSGAGASIGAIAAVAVTLLDDEASLGFSSPTYTVVEGGAAVNVQVTRSGAATGAVSITWTTSNGTAIAGSDFGTAGNAAQKTGVLSWGAGDSTPKTIAMSASTFSALPIINDTVIEPSKTFTITLSAPTGGAVLGPTSSTTVTIDDDDSTLQFSTPTVTVSEAGPNVTLTVTRAGSFASAASVTFATAAGTALPFSDYSSATGTLTWAAGDGGPKTITVGPTASPAPYIQVINDTTIEGPETFTVVLSAPTGATLGAATTATVTIDSDDKGIAMSAPTLSVAEAVGTAQVMVVRTGPPTGAISVNYTTANGTAVAPANYTTTTGTLNWADGDAAPKPINVPIIDNAVVNTARTFTVTLAGPVGATLGTPVTTTVTINDDDNTLQFSAATAVVTEGAGNLTLTVTRTGGTGGAASVTWTTADGTALAGTDFGTLGNAAAVTGTVNWVAGDAAAKTFNVPILDDALVEGAKTFTVTLSSPTGAGAAIGAIPTTTVTLNDNDSGVVYANSTYFVNENGGSLTMTVNRIGPVTSAASVTWTTANGSAISGTDFGVAGNAAARTGLLSWLAGDGAAKTFTIPMINNAIPNGARTFTVGLSAPSAGLVIGTPGTATVNIVDDESAAPTTLEFSAVKYIVLEGAGPAILSVTRAGDPSFPVTVNYTMAPGTALAGSDYTASTGTLTWAAGDSTAKVITIPITNDAIAESPEQFTVTLSAPSPGAGLGTNASTTVLIQDDDEVFPPLGVIPAGWVIPIASTTGWHASNDPGAYEGVYQLRTDTVFDNETAGIEVSGNYQAGTVAFRYKVSSELNFDFLRFFVDGVEVAKFSGTTVTGWTLYSVPVTAGPHTFRWVYEKDATATMGSDAAWIDAVTLPAAQ